MPKTNIWLALQKKRARAASGVKLEEANARTEEQDVRATGRCREGPTDVMSTSTGVQVAGW